MKQKSSLKSIVYQETLDGIIRGEYKANQIINEQELVEKFGFSKAPIREALLALCNEGVLHNIPRYGYEVIRLTSEDVEQILRYRFHLEGGFLRDCYQKISDPQLVELTRLDELCNSSRHDVFVHWEHNANFHLTLISCAGNDYAFRELKRAMDILKRAYAQTHWNRRDALYNSCETRNHRQLISCIRSKNIEEALHILELDLKNFGCM